MIETDRIRSAVIRRIMAAPAAPSAAIPVREPVITTTMNTPPKAANSQRESLAMSTFASNQMAITELSRARRFGSSGGIPPASRPE